MDNELTQLQKKVLALLRPSPLKEKFYWTGGTLLAAIYLHHRRSVDLDFFTDQPFVYEEVETFIESVKVACSVSRVEVKKIYDRWEFFLYNGEILRIEFVHYAHPRLKPQVPWNGIFIDDFEDIAANKLMAFFDRNEPKDLVDLYFMLKIKRKKITQLLKLVEKKFGVKFDEGSVWSEAHKHIRNLDTIIPLLNGNIQQQQKTIDAIKQYFEQRSMKYLHSRIEK